MSTWAEQYEAKKLARLAEERERTNPTRKFPPPTSPKKTNLTTLKPANKSSDTTVTQTKTQDTIHPRDQIKSNVGTLSPKPNKCVESSKIIPKQETVPSPVQGTKITKIGNGKIDESNLNKSERPQVKQISNDYLKSTSPPQNGTGNWLDDYAARKAAALENLNSGDIKSIGGSTGFVGVSNTGSYLGGRHSQVEKLMHRFKNNEPKKVTIICEKPDKNQEVVNTINSESMTNVPNLASIGRSVPSDNQSKEKILTHQEIKTSPNHIKVPKPELWSTPSPKKTKRKYSKQPCEVENEKKIKNYYKTQRGNTPNSHQQFSPNKPRPSCEMWSTPPSKRPCLENGIKKESAFSSKPPPTPDQLITSSTSCSPSPRPDRPGVPTPTRYGTHYGGAPSPGPCPNRNFQPPGFVPPTPPARVGLQYGRGSSYGPQRSMNFFPPEDESSQPPSRMKTWSNC